MVAAGEADFASIDHTVWDHHRDRFPDGRPAVVATTRDWPAPPITATQGTPPEWVEALFEVPGGHVVSRLVPAATADYTPIRQTASTLGWRKNRSSDPDRAR